MFKLAGMAACYAQLGRFEEATQMGREFIAVSKGETSENDSVSDEHWQSYWNRMYKLKNASDRQHLLDGLRKAGIPID